MSKKINIKSGISQGIKDNYLIISYIFYTFAQNNRIWN